jgi:cytochrome c peroxidase
MHRPLFASRLGRRSAAADVLRRGRRATLLGLVCLLVVVGVAGSRDTVRADPPGAPPEVLTGDRMSVETRFSQYFYAHAGGQVNISIEPGDPVLDTLDTTHGPVPGPFAHQAMNCRTCHLIDEGPGQRSYADFARRSPIPARDGDAGTIATRNSPPMVNAFIPRRVGFFLHADGEFTSPEALVKETMIGRNFGWLPEERATAIAHIANVVRNDDGSAESADAFGNTSYRDVLSGAAPIYPIDLPLPEAFRIDVMQASDEAVVDAVARMVSQYMRSLVFLQDGAGNYNGSPYDAFLEKNGLPRQPRNGQAALSYARRLRRYVKRLKTPQFVTEADGVLRLHTHPFKFGPEELAGLRIFLAESRHRASAKQLEAGGIGNCVACHAPPDFTDFSFHNTGATQEEYDSVHGQGSFAALAVPSLQTRNADPDRFLPPSAAHPRAQAPFRGIVTATHPGVTDLGIWNIYANPAFPDPDQQAALADMICRSLRRCAGRSQPGELLDAAVGLFKTSGLRDLSHSEPYLHTGRKDTLEDVITFYRDVATAARAGSLRNPAHELSGIALKAEDVAPLAAFLRSLDEDYR